MLNSFNLLRRIEKTAYESGINVALYHIENSSYYKNFQSKLENSIQKQVNRVDKNDIDRLLMFTKSDISPSLIVEVSTIVKTIADFIDFPEFLKQVGSSGGQIKLEQLGIDGKFTMKNKELIAYFDDHSRLLIDSVDNTTKEWIANTIQKGKDNGLTPQEIARVMKDEAKSMSSVRAEMIVLTETANAVSVTQKEVALKNGIKEQVWRTSIDERVCPICLPLEGKLAKIGDRYAGVLHPPAHPRCRCYLEDVVPITWEIPFNPWRGE